MGRGGPRTARTPLEAERVFLAKVQSDQLQAAFERCWNTPRCSDRLPDAPLGIPALICAALSAEIGIKALLFADGRDPGREHNLARLLELLTQATKSEIVEDVSASYSNFSEQLANAENAFVQWRYFYESKEELNINILFVGALGAAIQRQIDLKWVAA